MIILIVGMYFLLGLMIGSFANVCICRIPNDESVVRPRSHCPKCGTLIAWYDNVPLLSFALLRGKCRHCGMHISFQYPLIELTTGVAFAVVGWFFPVEPVTILYLYVTFALIAVTGIDWHHRIIPDVFSLSILVLGIAFSPFNTALGTSVADRLIAAAIGAATGFGVLFLVAYIGQVVMGQEVMGGGDIKLLCGLGAVLGWEKTLATLFLASLLGSIGGIALMIGGKMKRRDSLPFGPFLAGAAFANLFFSTPWALISRVDITRIPAIKLFLDNLI
jgi:leader peptidase (prepilin peptidase)/N-methyltransferase